VNIDIIGDVSKNLNAVAKRLADRGGQTAQRRKLFHYTTPNGLIGIVGSESLWASDMLCLSDASEATYGQDLIVRAIYEPKGGLVPSKHRDKFEESMRFAFRMYSAFVVCFCEDGDLLSQWRGYGGEGEGFALEFNRAWLSSRPRWTSENRPYVDTSKPANGAEPEQDYLYLARGRSGKHFCWTRPGGSILTSPGRRVRQRRDATGAPT